MAREKNDDIEFGSDSFLDVVANIVGILIILIVVAGIKAGAAPVNVARVTAYLKTHTAPDASKTIETEAPAASKPVAAEKPIPQPPLIIPASPELLREAEKIKSQMAMLESNDETATAKIQTTATDDKEIERRIAKVRRAIDEEMSELTQEQKKLVDAETRLDHQKTGLLQLEVDVQKAQAQKPAVKTLRHKLTPVSRLVQGKELHYQLLNNRIAYLPIQELMEQMRQSITDQRSRLYREGILQGQVGPILGFRMDFIARVRRLSTIDELRQGSSSTIELSKWQLRAEPDLDAEGPDTALKPGSDFLRFLRGADADTTITLWVYPDSFKIYRQVQEFVHHENFTVAARPLPTGFPITGSPTGSFSSGQ
jgi:hypothetical protein